MRPLVENVSARSSNRFPAKSVDMYENPVTFPPGRARFVTMPVPTKSPLKAITIGTVEVARLARPCRWPKGNHHIDTAVDEFRREFREPF